MPLDGSVLHHDSIQITLSCTTNDVENSTEVKQKVTDVFLKLYHKIVARVDHDICGYSKAIKCCGKTVEKLSPKNDATLQKVLFTFGKSVNQVILFH